MTRFRLLVPPALVLAVAAGCGDGSGPGAAVVECDQVEPTALAPGQLALLDAAETACVRLEGPGAGGDYLYVAYSAAGEESRDGTSAEYLLTGTAGTPPPAASVQPRTSAVRAGAGPTPAQRFHSRLRALGQDLARKRPAPQVSARAAPSTKAVPPVLGEQRTFNVLRNAAVSGTEPGDYVQVDGTARYVGTQGVIFLDDAAPTEGGYTLSDIEAIGSLFDDHLHPIDVTAFGDETDVNDDSVVLVLLTDRVTRLAGCGGGQVVVGLFFAVDLFEGMVGSNNAEIFYGLTPDEACGVDRDRAIELLPSVFIHEFQHMINYGQHVIVRDADAEDTWLDEGLSGFAEELGGRLVPDDRCIDNDCLTQFQANNIVNAYRYLFEASDAYLIGPRRPPLPLTQYGASWLFVRWLADHFAQQQPRGTDLTLALVQTTRTGAENVVSATSTSFDRLIGEWQLANYLEDHPDFQAISEGTRFEYTSWNLRDVFASFNQQDPVGFQRAYPLLPDLFDGDTYSRADTLRAGSGQQVLVEQGAGSVVDLRLIDPDGENPLSTAVLPRTALLRLR